LSSGRVSRRTLGCMALGPVAALVLVLVRLRLVLPGMVASNASVQAAAAYAPDVSPEAQRPIVQVGIGARRAAVELVDGDDVRVVHRGAEVALQPPGADSIQDEHYPTPPPSGVRPLRAIRQGSMVEVDRASLEVRLGGLRRLGRPSRSWIGLANPLAVHRIPQRCRGISQRTQVASIPPWESILWLAHHPGLASSERPCRTPPTPRPMIHIDSGASPSREGHTNLHQLSRTTSR
jgi:hypothetical protein